MSDFEYDGEFYELGSALEHNPQEITKVENIANVLAVVEGERDGPDWHWVILLNDDRFVYLTGGCDYSGWDCQSWLKETVLSEDMPLRRAVLERDDDDYGGDTYEVRLEALKSLTEQLMSEPATTKRTEVARRMAGGTDE